MKQRHVSRTIEAQTMSEGVGVTVHRSIGTRGLMDLDPFLLLDEFVIEEGAKGAGFPNHPHRGFETVTYMLSGRVEHADNAGNSGVIGPGGAQWMTAGRGIVHSEMPVGDGGAIRGLQLWVNLAADEKMKAPHYQDIAAAEIPSVTLANGGEIRVIAGMFGDVVGPVRGVAVNPLYLDLALGSGQETEISLTDGHQGIVYGLDGDILAGVERMPVAARALGILSDGDTLWLAGGDGGGRAVVASANPVAEPVARYGPFVMNTREEIQKAIEDFQSGKF